MLVSRAGASSQQLAASLPGQLSGGCHSSPQSAELVLLLVSEPMHRLMLNVENARNIVISGVAEQASLKLDWTECVAPGPEAGACISYWLFAVWHSLRAECRL